MNDARSVIAELDASTLDILDRPGDIERDRARLGVRHQPARTENLAEPADHAHHLGRGKRHVEVDLTRLHLLHEILPADDIRSGLDGLAQLLSSGEDRDAPRLPGAVRQRDRAPDDLVGVAWIDAEADMRLDRRIEGRDRRLANQGHRLGGGIELSLLDRARGLAVFLAVLWHCTLLWCWRTHHCVLPLSGSVDVQTH